MVKKIVGGRFKPDIRYWLSYDLGVSANYEDLYQWLDNMQAKECGSSVATFKSKKTRESLAKEISKFIDRNARVYIISMKRGGRFVLGKRKLAPWAGYAEALIESEEDI